jgi:hypothetical protein
MCVCVWNQAQKQRREEEEARDPVPAMYQYGSQKLHVSPLVDSLVMVMIAWGTGRRLGGRRRFRLIMMDAMTIKHFNDLDGATRVMCSSSPAPDASF